MPCGFLILNKVAGFTSYQCVAKVRQTYNLKRVGHAGTLDPDVMGVLTIAIGTATRLLPYLPKKKCYIGEIQLGQITTTDDLRGEIINNAIIPSLDLYSIQIVLNNFRGVIQQQPPQISAVHIRGERAYMRARRGENIIMPTKTVKIYQLELKHWEQRTGRLRLKISCSSGTYIRALARDIGKALGCGGCLAWLQRIEAQGFDLNQAVSLDILSKNSLPRLVTPVTALQHLNSYELTEDEYHSWQVGKAFPVAEIERYQIYGNSMMGPHLPLSVLGPNKNMVGIAFVRGNMILPKIVLNPQ